MTSFAFIFTFYSMMNNSSSPIPTIPHFQCGLYRLAGLFLLIASLINLIVSFQYFSQRYCRHSNLSLYFNNRFSRIIGSMLISSILVVFTGIPLVVIQCFGCRPYLKYEFICHIHGFICFTTGLFNMYIVALLSFSRYLSVLHKSSRFYRIFEEHRDACVTACALLAIAWALPPLFHFGTRFVREGIGFYCSLDWLNPARHSRIFLILLISFNYCIPFILLFYSNLRVCFTLRRLLKSRNYSQDLSLNYSIIPLEVDLRKSLSDARLKETTNRLQRLKLDRRYGWITAMIASQYLIAWTPYALIEILNMTGRTTFIERNAFLPTFCALLAKLSLILNPLVLMYTSKMTET